MREIIELLTDNVILAIVEIAKNSEISGEQVRNMTNTELWDSLIEPLNNAFDDVEAFVDKVDVQIDEGKDLRSLREVLANEIEAGTETGHIPSIEDGDPGQVVRKYYEAHPEEASIHETAVLNAVSGVR